METNMDHSWTPSNLPEGLLTLMQAIGRMEGWYAELEQPTRPQRNNNPGDIEHGVFAQQHGAISSDGRFAVFPSPTEGFNCLEALLRSPAYAKLTLAQMVTKYAPSPENDTAMYLRSLCRWTGRKPTDLVGDCL